MVSVETAGTLISFEGVDGCGKSTQIELLVNKLRSNGLEVITLREPGGTTLGEQVRTILLDPKTGDISAAAEALLYAASRAELVENTIEPALKRGCVVILDRYIDSSLAYQGAGRELGIDRVLEANLLATRGRLPDITVLVRVPAEVALKRLEVMGDEPDRLEAEGQQFFMRIHQAYDELAERFPERICVVDGADTIEGVEQQIIRKLDERFKLLGIDLLQEEGA